MKLESLRNNSVDFNPTLTKGGVITGGILTFNDGTSIAADGNGKIKLPFSATLFINTPGSAIRVTTLQNGNAIGDSVLFKNLLGDFHREIKFIWSTDTTDGIDLIFDVRTDLTKNN